MKFLAFIFLLITLFFGYIVFTEPNTNAIIKKQDFIISRGDTLSTLPVKFNISRDVNPLFYKLYLRFKQKDFILQAGTYHMEKDETLTEFFENTLKNPQSKDITITILPGWNIFDIDVYLSKLKIIKEGDFIGASENISDGLRKSFLFLGNMKSLEGFLLPETYRINPDATVDGIISTLLAEFNKEIYKNFSLGSSKEFYEALIFASIVEKEEKDPENKPTVAGILKKRYKEKMAIGADATVCYNYRLTMEDCTPIFIWNHIEDKTSVNPYNTRNSLILPPTPIANPSAETFIATINSKASPYYYYLHDISGNIHYGTTLEEHNRNKVDFLGN